MPAYQKICIICSKNFYTQRLNTLYCGRSCRNRARYLPPNLLASLARRNSQFAIQATANRYTQMMIEDNGAANPQAYNKDAFKEEDVELYKKSIVLGLDSRVKAPDKPIEIKRNDDKTKTIPADTPIDNEMLDLKLEDYHEIRNIGGSIEAEISIDNTLPDPDDDGITTTSEARISVGNQQDDDKEKPVVGVVVKRGIRKIGGRK